MGVFSVPIRLRNLLNRARTKGRAGGSRSVATGRCRQGSRAVPALNRRWLFSGETPLLL